MASTAAKETCRLYSMSYQEREKEMWRLHNTKGEGRLVVITVRQGDSQAELAALEVAAALDVGTFVPIAYINEVTLICGVRLGEQRDERITQAILQGRHVVQGKNRKFNMSIHVFEPPRRRSNSGGSQGAAKSKVAGREPAQRAVPLVQERVQVQQRAVPAAPPVQGEGLAKALWSAFLGVLGLNTAGLEGGGAKMVAQPAIDMVAPVQGAQAVPAAAPVQGAQAAPVQGGRVRKLVQVQHNETGPGAESTQGADRWVGSQSEGEGGAHQEPRGQAAEG